MATYKQTHKHTPQTACAPVTGSTPNSANQGPDFVCYFNALLSGVDLVPCQVLLQVRTYNNNYLVLISMACMQSQVENVHYSYHVWTTLFLLYMVVTLSKNFPECSNVVCSSSHMSATGTTTVGLYFPIWVKKLSIHTHTHAQTLTPTHTHTQASVADFCNSSCAPDIQNIYTNCGSSDTCNPIVQGGLSLDNVGRK